MSKSALNQATRTMAIELKRQGTYAIALHPGTTGKDLLGPTSDVAPRALNSRFFRSDATVLFLPKTRDYPGRSRKT